KRRIVTVERVSAATRNGRCAPWADQVPLDEQYCACCACAVASCASRALSLITCCLPSPPVTTGCLLRNRLTFELNCLHNSARLEGVSACLPLDAAVCCGALVPGSGLLVSAAGGGLEAMSGSLVRCILVKGVPDEGGVCEKWVTPLASFHL